MEDKIKFLLKGGNILDQFDCLEELLEDIDGIEEDDVEISDVLDEMDDFDTDFSDFCYGFLIQFSYMVFL